MEVSEQVYEGGQPSKTTKREDANYVSHSCNFQGGESNLLTKKKEPQWKAQEK